jgi:saccharopepsin
MSFSGQWKNSYNSVMTLIQAVDGTISGIYSSTTGSTGEYYVLGYANPADATPALGQAAALSIYWLPYNGGTADQSWHWVSGLSGQMTLAPDGSASLVLLHAMVATCDFPTLPAAAGTYLDKLVYTPYTPVTTVATQAPQIVQPPAAAADPVSGTWVCSNPQVTLSLQAVMARPGQLSGVIDIPGHLESKIQGFADVNALSGGLNLEGVTVTAFDSTTGQCISLAGSLNLTTGVLTLTDLTSSATTTTPNNAYLQTTTATWIFTRSA